jgi:hypothetical protein
LDSASGTGPLHWPSGAQRIRSAGEMWAIHEDDQER